jgi:hypothetical protein
MYRIIGADGREYGPISAEQLRAWMAEGRVNHQTRIRAEDSADWKTVADLPEFSTPPPIHPSIPPSMARPLAPGAVPNHLVFAILVTLCCCLPLGIPAIVYAGQVNGRLSAGDQAGAQEASRKAQMWCWIAFGLGIISNLLSSLYWLGFGMMRHHPWR